MRGARLGMVAGLTVALLVGTGSFADANAAIRLGKIQYNSPGTDTGSNSSLNAEWVTIKNTGTTRRNLLGWTLRDAAGHIYHFNSTYYLRADSSVRIHTGRGTNTRTDRYWGRGWYVWNNTGDTARLRNRAGTLIDSCRWTGAGPGYIYC